MICFGFVYQLYPVGTSVLCSHTSSRRNSRLGRYGHHSCFPYTERKRRIVPIGFSSCSPATPLSFYHIFCISERRHEEEALVISLHFPIRYSLVAVATCNLYHHNISQRCPTIYLLCCTCFFFVLHFLVFVSRLGLSKNELGGVCWFL